MFLTKDQVKQILGNAPPGSDPGKIIKSLVDKGAILEGFNEPKEGILKSIAKSVVTPIAKFGVQAANFGESVYDLAKGDVAGANAATNKSRNVPLLGKVDPYVKGSDSTKQVIKGTLAGGLELGSLVAGGGGLGAIGKATVGTAVKQGVIQGTKFGAATGFLGSTGQELQKKDSTGNSILDAGVNGALGGAVTGGLFGGVAPIAGKAVRGVTEFVAGKAERAANKVSKDAYEIISPVLSKKEKISAIENGRAYVKGKLGTTELVPQKRDLQVAKAVEGLVSKKKSWAENVSSIRGAIKQEAKQLANEVKNNDQNFDYKELAGFFNKIEKPPMVQSDEVLKKSYQIAQKKFVQFVKQEGNTLSGVLNARKKFDVWVEKQFPRIFENPRDIPLQTALKDMRTAANDFVASKLPAGNAVKASLKKQNLMYEAIHNIANKEYKYVDMNRLQRFAKKNPRLTKGLEWGIGTTAVGGALTKIAN